MTIKIIMDKHFYQSIYNSLHNYIKTIEQELEELRKENKYLKSKLK